MKKLVLTLSLALVSALAADAQVLFYEDFDGIGGPTAGGAGTYTFPAGWFLRNVDNRTPDAQTAYVNEAWERREDFNFNVGDSCAFSTSFYSPVGPADDWMWTPLVGPLPANTILSWNAVTYDPNYRDGYEVRIMTSAQGPPTGGTGVLGNQVTNSTQVFSTAAENTSWTTQSVNLSAYAGQSVYVAFRNTSNDKFLLLIDDVKLEVQVNIDAEMLVADTATEYTMIPVTQTAGLNFNGTIRNSGLNALSNVMAQVNVYNGTTNVYSATSATTASLAAGATIGWNVAPFTPAAVGTYTVEFIAMQSSGVDQRQTNDTLWQTFEVTDSTYARDNGVVTGTLGVGNPAGGYLGQDFVVSTTDDLTSIGIYYTEGYPGRRFALCVWDMVSGSPNQIVAVTDTLIYPDDSARYYVVPIHNVFYTLVPGRYAVTAIEFPADSTIRVGLTNDVFTQNRTWVQYATTPWLNNEDYGPSFARTYVIRPNFGDICLNNIATTTSTSATCSTCMDGSATVTATGTLGPVTYNWAPAGGNAATATGLMTGIYTVTVTDSYGCVVMDTIAVAYDTCFAIASTTSSTDASCGSCADGSATVNVSGNNGTVTYLWSNGGTTATISNVLAGTYYVTITDSLGCMHMDSVVVNFNTDVAGLNTTGAIGIFPNPSNGVFQVNVSLQQPADLTVFITNTLGETVATKTVSGMQNGRIDMNVDLASGAYNLHVRTVDAEKIVPVNIRK